VETYFTVQVLFWYRGLLSGLTTIRDGTPPLARQVFSGVLGLGCRY
jgi:hypothetical protein